MNENYVFPDECRAIIDVTKPPYNIDNTGKIDCTKQLCAIVDEVLQNYERAFYETKEKLEAIDDDNALISFEIRKINGRSNVIFPEVLPESKIIYFPNGTYLVSDTISYSMEEFRNFICSVRAMEMNCQLRFFGQSRDGVILKLQDNCKGFEYGNDRPVIDFLRGEASNIAMTNMLENMTIDIGSGNPGATGVRYFANNTGAIRNVKIVSSDPDGRGHTGLSMLHPKISAGYTRDVEVIGFNYGIRVASQSVFSTFEHITLKNQNRYGFFIEDNMVAIRDLYSENFVPAVKIDGFTASVTLTDAKLVGGNPLDVAIKYNYGNCMARNVSVEGYERAISRAWLLTVPLEAVTEKIDEVVSAGPVTLFGENVQRSLDLPVEDTPEVPWAPVEDWISVNECGAVGDGVTDDTEAIRRALRSGRSTVYFQPGKYVVDDVIEVPATVRRINFMYSDLVSGDRIKTRKNTGVFLIKENSETPLLIEDLFAWEKFKGFMTLLEHACTRMIVVSDVHVQGAAIYFNTVPGGKVFMENTGCTIGGVPAAGTRTKPLPHEDWDAYSRETPCFSFWKQEVYCRQLDPERSLHEVVNDGGKLWVLGFKSEEEGTAFETRNGGFTEVLGAVFALGFGKSYPAVINDNSNVSVYARTIGMLSTQTWPILIREIQGDEVRELKLEDSAVQSMATRLIPLYVGRKQEE